MGVMDRYNEKRKKKQDTSSNETTSSGVRERYEARKYYSSLPTDSVDKKYIDTFISDSTNFLSSARDSYNSLGWSNASSSYDTVSSTWKDLYTRGNTIRGWLYKNGNAIDKETYDSVSKTLDSFNTDAQSIIKSFEDALNEYSQFESEDAYNEYYNRYAKYGELANSAEGATGYQKYLDDKEAQMNAAVQAEEDKAWWEKLLGYLGEAQDTTLPMGQMNATIEALREDVSYARPQDDWKEEQKNVFGALYSSNPTEAYHYAEYTNKLNKKAAEAEKIRKIQESATSSFGAGFGHTLGAIATAPLGMADFLNDLAYANAGRDIVPDGNISPFEYSQAVTGGVSSHLNTEYGTLDDRIPLVGGKGLGDLYGWGSSTAQSISSAYTMGSVGMLFSYFGQGAASSVDDMLSRGASDEQALVYGTAVGLIEGALEALGGERMLRLGPAEGKSFIKQLAEQAAAEGLEGGLSSAGSKLADFAIDRIYQGGINNFDALVEEYTATGMSKDKAILKALVDNLEEVAFDALSEGLSGAVGGGVQTGIQNISANKQASAMYGDNTSDLVNEALEIDPNNKFAQRMQNRLEGGKNLSGGQINRLIDANEATMRSQDVSAIQSAAKERLTTLGETGNVEAIAKALTKQAQGERLTVAERHIIKNSKYGQRVANELNTENIKSGQYSSAWSEKIGTNRINAEEYRRALTDAEVATDTNVGDKTSKTAQTAEITKAVEIPSPAPQASAPQAENAPVTENTPVKENATESEFEASEEAPESKEMESTVTLADASQKYGAQAQAMIHTYTEGQDVAKYDKAYGAAYDMGMSGVSVDYAKNSDSTAYLTEKQRELAYEAGRAAADTNAKEQDAKNKSLSNGKTGRRKGTVKGEGVTISDLKKSFNDTQNKAYKILSTYAEATGVDIVLYKSEADADGNFIGSQGKFKWSEDTIYIDINAGLGKIKDVDDLAKFAMIRTFSHEFTHFIEKWNPIWYNEFRKVVFDTLTQRGENVHDLIETKMSMTEGMTYEKASREVVAEAMTDILPDANFVETLANEHKTIFDKLLEKLKEFLTDLKAYFNSIGHNRSREANALKDQVEGAVHYVDNIVKLFDKVAVEAVENYQATVATEEATVSKMEEVETEVVSKTENTTVDIAKDATHTEEASPETETPVKAEVKTNKSENGYTLTDDANGRILTIKFEGKPSDEVRVILKNNAFVWSKAKGEWFRSGKWYGKNSSEDVIAALDAAYEAEAETETKAEEPETKPVAEKTATETLREMGGKAVSGNMTDVTDLFFPELAKSETSTEEAETVDITETSTKDVYDDLAEKLRGSYFVKENGLNFGIRGNDKDGYHGFINRRAEASDGRYPVENAFDRIYSSDVFKTYDEVVEDIVSVAKMSKLLKPGDNITNNIEEVNQNVENADNERPILEPDTDGERASRSLDEQQAENVSGASSERNAVDDTRQRESEAERDGDRTDAANRLGRSEGDSERGDLRELTEESAEQVTGKLPASEQETQTKAEELAETVEREIEQKSTEQPKGNNFVIGDSLNLPNGEKARFRANVDAIRLIKQLETEGRFATASEQEILSKYVGWGGLSNAFGDLTWNRETRKQEMVPKDEWKKEFAELKSLVDEGIITEQEYKSMSGSTKNAHYTSIEVIKAMYDGLAALGFKGGRMLEPSSGVGNFVGAMPLDMTAKVNSWTMVEIERVTGLIAKYLYPNSDVRIQGFENANIPDNYMDVAIGNVPFGDFGVVDRTYPKRITKSIHNYFFAKSIDKVRPGGIVMFITSSFTMNAKDTTVRQYIMERADLLGAIRLPNTAFKGNAGTDVVTDILILKKREGGTEYAGEDFLAADYDHNYGAYTSNYFKNHPEMVLGKPVTKRGMYGASTLTFEPFADRGTIDDQIREAFKNIKGKMDYSTKPSPEKTNFAVEKASKKSKAGGLVVNSDGTISRNENGQLVKYDTDEKTAKRIAGMLSIRDAYKTLANYLQQGQDAKYIKQARKALNEAYDKFVKEHGYINSPANKKAIDSDPDQYSILSLENYDAKKKSATKADIFTKDTISANKTVTHVDNVEEGVIASINLTGGVDTTLIAKLTGKTVDDVTREIINSRLAFKTRNNGLVARETYLSGNVRAKLREAESLAPYDSDFNNNIEELRKIIPADIPYNEIYITPGNAFIPNEVYADFIAHMLGGRNNPNSYSGPDVEVGRMASGDFKIVLNNKRLKNSYYNTQTWGTARKSFLDLIDSMMGSRTIKVNDTIENADGKKVSVVNEAETEAANEKARAIQKEFEDWIWKDEDRRTMLARLYNETFNAIVNPKYDGSHLSVNGINADYSLRPHQANAVHRIISSGGNTLLAHRVGAGKTLEMAAAAMKMRELGVIKKPVFVVPKNVVAQWGVEFHSYFPAARLLVADDKSFTPANRKIFTNQIANGDYDAVIVSYEQFEKIPMSAEYQTQFYEEQINEIIAAIAEEKAESRDGKGLTVKEMEKKKAQLEKKLKELTSKPKDENNVDFEMLGIDSLFVDEAHNFKNLEYVSKMSNVAGLGSPKGAQRAFDLYTKIRYLQGLNGGRGIVFATATPVMNSMVELYIMQRYLQPDVLNQLNLKSFDAWAKQFGEVVNKWEINPSGTGMRQKQVFANFRNLNELQLLFRSFADVLTEVPGLKIPKMKGGAVKIVECEPGEFQKNYMLELQKRAENVKNVDPTEDNMLKITSDGRKVSYTQRMIDPTLPYEPTCKIFMTAENILKEYKDSANIKGTQIVFLDMATPKGTDKSKAETNTENSVDDGYDEESARLYDDMRDYLVKKGIPKSEIAFIHEANTDVKKAQLFEDVNNGKVRVLMGSTGKMGVGMNAQKRVVAIHHLDAPWRPGDVEQRDGRAFRQKNINDEVSKYVYVTKGSFDSRLWDILDRKQHFINQIMNGEDVGRTAEDTGEVTLSAAEVKALASGNPLIEEQTKLTDAIKKLENLQKAYNSSIVLAKTKLSDDEVKIANYTSRIARVREDIKVRVDTYSEGKFSMTVGNQVFTDNKEAGAALAAAIVAKANANSYVTVGKFAGFELRVIKNGAEYSGLIHGKESYKFNVYLNNTTRMANHIGEIIAGFENMIKNAEQMISETTADLNAQKNILAQPFEKQDELNQKRARFNEVMELLAPKTEEQLGKMDDDTVQEQSRGYLDYGEEVTELNKSALIDIAIKKLTVGEHSLQEIRSVFESLNINSELDILFDRVYDFCMDADVRILVEPKVIDKNAITRSGSAKGNKIILSQAYFRNKNVPAERKASTILHEMIHTATVYAMNEYIKVRKGESTAMMSKEMYKACEQIFAVHLKIKDDPLFAKEYGVTNARELVAELSNPDFVVKLKRTHLSLWDELLDLICRMFHIKKSFTAYDKLKKALDVLLSHPNNQLRQSYYEVVAESVENTNDYSDYTVQEQQRTDTLTDREVLEFAANEVKVSDLSQAENDALTIFRDRLSKLKDLQDERAEQGRLYKEQQFGEKVDRTKAAETLNRMHILDDQIKKATAEVLTVEEKEVLKRVLSKARKVVEAQEREHGKEILNRWRDRRNNAAAIKKYRDRLRGDVDELSNWILHPNNKDIVKHVPDVLKNTVIPFLSSINFMSKRALKGGAATKADTAFMETLKKLNAAIKINIDAHGLYSGYNDLPPNFMERLQTFIESTEALVKKNSGDLVINQMTGAELKELSQVVRTLKKYIMQVNSFHNNAMYEHVYEAGENSIEHLQELGNAGNTGAVSSFLLWQQIRPAYAFERFGKGGEAIYDGLRRGQAKLAFNTKEIQEFTEKAYTEKEVKAWENEIKTFRLGRDVVKMPVSYIMAFYELSKDPEALEHINGEGIRVATYTHKGKKISDTGHILTVGEFNQIIGSLTDRQREVANALQKYMAEQGGKWGNYVSVARFGEELFTNKNYFPINSDGRHLQANADEHPSAASLYALLNMSFTKSRKEGANNRIVIYSIFDVFANHMASMAQYNAMALPILDALKWFNYQQVFIDDDGTKHIGDSVRERMDRAYGVPEETRPGRGKSGYAQDFVMNIIKAFNGTEAQGTPYDSFGLKPLHRYNIAQVAYNLRVVVQQPMAITRAAMLLDYGSIIRGMKLKPSEIKKNIEEMQKYSGIAAWKSLGFYDVNISRGLTHLIKHDSTVMDKVGDVGMWGAEKADTLTWAAIWSAAKEEVRKKQHLTPESEGFYEAVTKLFEDVIYKTQVVDSVLTKNEFMRDKGAFARLVGSFMSEPTTNASMLIDAYDKYHLDMQRGMTRQQAWQKNRKMIGRRLYVYAVGAILLAAVQAAADALRDDDDYEEWYEKWLKEFGGNLVDELLPFNKLPILSDFYDLAKELLSIFGVDTYGNPPQSVFMQWYDSLINGTEIIYQKISGEDTNYTWYGGIYKLLQAASGITGLPMASATREIITAWNNTVGAMAPSLKLKTYEPSELSQIRYAYEDGYLSAEEATAQILEKGLADTEDEAYFIIQGWEAGDGYSRYDKIYDAVRNGASIKEAMDELTSHGYTEEDVLSQVKSEVGKWYRRGEISKQQTVNMLTKYFGMESSEINSTIAYWEYKRDNPDADVNVGMFEKYNSDVAASGMSINAYIDYRNKVKDITGEDKKARRMEVINSLSITNAQKDALYFAEGWAASKLHEAPWH